MGVAPEDFNPNLRTVIVDSWWELGKLAGLLADARSKTAKLAIAKEYAAKASKRMREDLPRSNPINAEPLLEFVETAVELLERKYDGKPIAKEIQRLIQPGRFTVADEDGYLVVLDDEREFWAAEYTGLFSELTPGRTRDDWRHAVARCADEQCRKFFVKRRVNQTYHADKCRFNVANRAKVPKRTRRPGAGGKR